MPIEQLLALAIIQGITEFLPISSSAHLNLAHLLTTWQDEGPLIDVAIHIGSLVAVMAYFWRDMVMLLRGLGHLLAARLTPESRMLLYLVAATLPILAAGFVVMSNGWMDDLRTLAVIAWANLVFALLLWLADARGLTDRGLERTTLTDAIIVGVAQVFSIIPGASRAGVTMTAARMLGFERTDAARFSMLLSIPTILALGLAAAWKIYGSGNEVVQEGALVAGALSCVTALVSIWLMMALLRRTTMFAFVAYRLVLGVLLLGIVYGIVPWGAAG